MKLTHIILLSGMILSSCSKKEEITPAETYIKTEDQITLTDLQKKNAGIEVANMQNENLSNVIQLTGQIDVPPTGMSNVSAMAGGVVKMTRFLPGNYVTKGQTLAIIENPDMARIQQDYLQAKSNLSYAQKDYERQKYLNQYQASSDKVTQKAANEAQSQSAAVRGLEAQMRTYGINPNQVSAGNINKSIVVTAPISGYIAKVNTALGQFVSPTDILFQIVNNSRVHLALKVFEKDLHKIYIGQKVYAYTNQNPDKKIPAKVVIIGKDFGPDRSVLVHCDLLKDDPNLIVGTYMNGELEVDSQDGFVVPDDAVITWNKKQYIFEEIKPKTYKMFPVTIGNSENGYTQLVNFNAQHSTKNFVKKGAYQLLMALKNVEE